MSANAWGRYSWRGEFYVKGFTLKSAKYKLYCCWCVLTTVHEYFSVSFECTNEWVKLFRKTRVLVWSVERREVRWIQWRVVKPTFRALLCKILNRINLMWRNFNGEDLSYVFIGLCDMHVSLVWINLVFDFFKTFKFFESFRCHAHWNHTKGCSHTTSRYFALVSDQDDRAPAPIT